MPSRRTGARPMTSVAQSGLYPNTRFHLGVPVIVDQVRLGEAASPYCCELPGQDGRIGVFLPAPVQGGIPVSRGQ
ncbi:MAG: hypothetical protein KL787_07355 [Taibaiella sp.]|nr:hypothetical protein [Taibaiella sp.]